MKAGARGIKPEQALTRQQGMRPPLAPDALTAHAGCADEINFLDHTAGGMFLAKEDHAGDLEIEEGGGHAPRVATATSVT